MTAHGRRVFDWALESARSALAVSVLLVVAVSVLSGCSDRQVGSTNHRTDEIIGGAASNNLPVVRLISPVNGCSGTVVSNRVVLTAKHCLAAPANQINVFKGPNGNVLEGAGQFAFVPRDGADIAALVITRTTVPAMAVRNQPLVQGNCGNQVRLSGYGQQGPGGPVGVQMEGRAIIAAIGPPAVGANEFQTRPAAFGPGGLPMAGACPGDSGGAAIGAATGQLVGVISKSTCAMPGIPLNQRGFTIMVRVDPYVGPLGPGQIKAHAERWRDQNPGAGPAPGGFFQGNGDPGDDDVIGSDDFSEEYVPEEDAHSQDPPDDSLFCQETKEIDAGIIENM